MAKFDNTLKIRKPNPILQNLQDKIRKVKGISKLLVIAADRPRKKGRP